MRIYKVILIPIISLALKVCGMRVLLGRNRSLLGAVSIADNARQGHWHRPGVKRRGGGRAVKEVKACLGRWLHLQGRAVKAVQACLGLRLHLQLGHNYRWLNQSSRRTGIVMLSISHTSSILKNERMKIVRQNKNDDEPSATEALRSFRLHVCTCAFQSYAQLLTQPSLKGESPAMLDVSAPVALVAALGTGHTSPASSGARLEERVRPPSAARSRSLAVVAGRRRRGTELKARCGSRSVVSVISGAAAVSLSSPARCESKSVVSVISGAAAVSLSSLISSSDPLMHGCGEKRSGHLLRFSSSG